MTMTMNGAKMNYFGEFHYYGSTLLRSLSLSFAAVLSPRIGHDSTLWMEKKQSIFNTQSCLGQNQQTKENERRRRMNILNPIE